MQTDFDVTIIGAGVVGLAIAARLAKSGKKVLVLETNDGIGQITSSRNRLKKYEAELETMMEKPGDKDFTIMRIIIKGKESKNNVKYEYNLLDRYQKNIISMARTTGFTCTAVTNLIINGTYNRIGISPPEYLGKHFNFIKKYLEDRNVKYNVKKI